MYPLLKRISDIIISFSCLVILSPLFIIIYILVFLFSGFPVFYKQERVGRNWEKFYLYKFRTMERRVEQYDANITCIDDPRITRLGTILRKYKLDELPQLINVLMGNMSIVGPRPELFKFASIYKNEYDQILMIKPGISDFASIKYRNENFLLKKDENPENYYLNNILPDKINLNKKYISEASIITDYKIIVLTLKEMFNDTKNEKFIRAHQS